MRGRTNIQLISLFILILKDLAKKDYAVKKNVYKIFSPKTSGQELFRLKINQNNILFLRCKRIP